MLHSRMPASPITDFIGNGSCDDVGLAVVSQATNIVALCWNVQWHVAMILNHDFNEFSHHTLYCYGSHVSLQ